MGYTAGQVEAIWVQAGGNPAAAQIAAAVAFAESSATSNAVSPSSDYGLWQIHLATHLGQGGISWTNWATPTINARAAIVISTNGANWGPWCTAWATPADCASGPLATPQPGSPAAYHLNQITSGATPGGTPPPYSGPTPLAPGGIPTPPATLAETWGRIQWDAWTNYNVQMARIQSAINAIGG